MKDNNLNLDLKILCNPIVLTNTILRKIDWLGFIYDHYTLLSDLCNTDISQKCLQQDKLGFYYTTNHDKNILRIILAYIGSRLGLQLELGEWSEFAGALKDFSLRIPITKIVHDIRKISQDIRSTPYKNTTPLSLVLINLIFIIYKVIRLNTRDYGRLYDSVAYYPTNLQILGLADYQQGYKLDIILTDFVKQYMYIYHRFSDYDYFNNKSKSDLLWNIASKKEAIYMYLKIHDEIIMMDADKVSLNKNKSYHTKLDSFGYYIFYTVCDYIYCKDCEIVYDSIPTIVSRIALTQNARDWEIIDANNNHDFKHAPFLEMVDIVRDISMVYKSITGQCEFLRMFNLAYSLTLEIVEKWNESNKPYITSSDIKNILDFILNKKYGLDQTTSSTNNQNTVRADKPKKKNKIRLVDLFLIQAMLRKNQ